MNRLQEAQSAYADCSINYDRLRDESERTIGVLKEALFVALKDDAARALVWKWSAHRPVFPTAIYEILLEADRIARPPVTVGAVHRD